MAAERGWLGYKDDTGVIWNAYVGLFNRLDFVAFSAARAPLPRNLRMRYVTCQSATTGRKRRLWVGDITSTWWTGVSIHPVLTDADGSSDTYTVTGRVGEAWTRLQH